MVVRVDEKVAIFNPFYFDKIVKFIIVYAFSCYQIVNINYLK
jgi:hypothetical protein